MLLKTAGWFRGELVGALIIACRAGAPRPGFVLGIMVGVETEACFGGVKSTAGLATSILCARTLSGVDVADLGGVWEEVGAGLGGVWEGIGPGLGGV